jgi:nucleotide-binding universal stress UspA family protein
MSRPVKNVVVVGVDGSDGGKAALEWAVHQAELTHSKLLVVAAWHLPTSYGFPVLLDDTDLASNARDAAEAALRDVVGDRQHVPVRVDVIEGDPRAVLVAAAVEADLLVVGASGHGELTGMLAGSVAEHCVHHAPCPVVVVR